MPDAKINGSMTKPIPAGMKSALAKGYPKHVAQAMGKKPSSTVKV